MTPPPLGHIVVLGWFARLVRPILYLKRILVLHNMHGVCFSCFLWFPAGAIYLSLGVSIYFDGDICFCSNEAKAFGGEEMAVTKRVNRSEKHRALFYCNHKYTVNRNYYSAHSIYYRK